MTTTIAQYCSLCGLLRTKVMSICQSSLGHCERMGLATFGGACSICLISFASITRLTSFCEMPANTSQSASYTWRAPLYAMHLLLV